MVDIGKNSRLERTLGWRQEILKYRRHKCVVRVVHHAREFPAQSVVQGKRRSDTERILEIGSPGCVVLAVDERRELFILTRLFIDVLKALDLADTAGENRVQSG